MVTTVEHKTKKRKHAAAETAGEPSTKRSKTATENKTRHKSKDGKKKDGSGKHTGGQFKVVRSTLAISLPPVFAGRPREGAEEMLDSLVMRYVPALQGVLLAHDSLQFLSSSATIKGDCPFANCTISFSSTVWSPRVGMKLVGKVNLCSPDHVSLLVHRTFNVSIPRHHIPTDNWEFEYGPAENDPEFGVETADATEGDGAPSEAVESSGRWVHKLTGEKLGGENGSLEFTVIGLTIANQMLSLVGSIQHDPFSPEHVPDHSTITVASRKQSAAQPAATFETFDREEDANSDEDVDTFETLARLNNEAEEVEGAQKSKQKKDDEEKKEKKRKRKSEKAAAQAEDGGDGQPEKKRKKKKDPSS